MESNKRCPLTFGWINYGSDDRGFADRGCQQQGCEWWVEYNEWKDIGTGKTIKVATGRCAMALIAINSLHHNALL